MNLGDILTGEQVHDLPVGSVVVHDSDGDEAGWFNTVTRTKTGFAWYSIPEGHAELVALHVDGWRLVHLPKPPTPKVGDVISTAAQAEALPVGSVVVDPADDMLAGAPAFKVEDDRWVYFSNSSERAAECGDLTIVEVTHRVVYTPDADTSAGRTAA